MRAGPRLVVPGGSGLPLSWATLPWPGNEARTRLRAAGWPAPEDPGGDDGARVTAVRGASSSARNSTGMTAR
jgi:hypothetical protein